MWFAFQYTQVHVHSSKTDNYRRILYQWLLLGIDFPFSSMLYVLLRNIYHHLLFIHLLTAILVYTDINDHNPLDSLIFSSFILLSNNPLSHSAQTLSINIVKYCEILSSWERLARGRRSPLSWKAPPKLLYRPDTSPGSDCARYSSPPPPMLCAYFTRACRYP
jgi:hypothetical protein